MTRTNGRPSHVFTVDVEEYFQVSAFQGEISRSEWDALPSRVERNVDDVLEMLERHDARGTFFVLGWVAERHPRLVRRIAQAGHEVASHGWSHELVTRLERDEFRTEVRDSKRLLEDLAGEEVIGYRAPAFSIVPGHEWAFDVLLEEGYRYDSSIFPIRRPGYGYPSAPPVPHMVQRPAGELLELPLATSRWAGFRLPGAGGAYFRHLPYGLTRRALRQHEEQTRPAVFYMHPWELDPDQPRLPVSWLARLRHYGGLEGMRRRLERLFSDFRFSSVGTKLARGEISMDAHAMPMRSY